jgi:hypothetical protein
MQNQSPSVHNRGTVREINGCPTTKRFPRTLDEAFGHGADYGCAIVHYKNHWSWVARASAFIIWVLALAWGATLWI